MNAAAHLIEDDDDRAGDPPTPERPTFHRVTEEVDPRGFVERWSGPGLAECLTCKTALTTPLLPGLSIALPALFRGGLG